MIFQRFGPQELRNLWEYYEELTGEMRARGMRIRTTLPPEIKIPKQYHAEVDKGKARKKLRDRCLKCRERQDMARFPEKAEKSP
jgi:hypothetical protein